MNIHAENASQLYADVLRLILRDGGTYSPRGMETRELPGVRLHLPDATRNLVAFKARKLNYYFMIAEWLWILLGQNDVASISRFNSKIADYSDDGVVFGGAYGPKVTEQLPYVLDKLRSDRDSRQAVLTIWRERPGGSKDIPCTVAIQYLLRDDHLNAITFMRSNDAWLGLPYDLFNFTMLQGYVAAALDVKVGSYTHFVGSLHLYDWSFDAAQDTSDEFGPENEKFGGLELSYPYPLEVRGIFNALARPELKMLRKRATELEKICDTAKEPWAQYLKVLARRTHGEVKLDEPWNTLITEYGV